MHESAVRHPVAQDAVQQSIPVFDKARIGQRLYAETAQCHRDLIGAFDVFRPPTGKVTGVQLERRQAVQRLFQHLAHGLCDLFTALFQRIGIRFLAVAIRSECLQCHCRNVRVGAPAAQGKPAVRQLLTQDLQNYIIPGIEGSVRDRVAQAVQRDKPPYPTIDALPPKRSRPAAVVCSVRDKVDRIPVRIGAEGGRVAAHCQHGKRDAMPLGCLGGAQLARFPIAFLHPIPDNRQVGGIIVRDTQPAQPDGIPIPRRSPGEREVGVIQKTAVRLCADIAFLPREDAVRNRPRIRTPPVRSRCPDTAGGKQKQETQCKARNPPTHSDRSLPCAARHVLLSGAGRLQAQSEVEALARRCSGTHAMPRSPFRNPRPLPTVCRTPARLSPPFPVWRSHQAWHPKHRVPARCCPAPYCRCCYCHPDRLTAFRLPDAPAHRAARTAAASTVSCTASNAAITSCAAL